MARDIPQHLQNLLPGLGAQARRLSSGVEADASVRLGETWDVVCYDTETTDKERDFCQILQFAGLLADRDFNVVQSRNLLVRLLPYVVPSPGALKVNGVDPRTLDDDERHDEYDAAVALRSLLYRGSGNRVFLTFNGIKFDDEIIRRTLYRNFQNPYFSRDNDTRIDVLRLTRLVAASHNAGLVVPTHEEVGEDGRRRGDFRLTSLCEANGIAPFEAHDALGDSRATLALAGLIRRIAPWAWNVAFACGSPEASMRRAKAAKAAGQPLWLFDPWAGTGEDAFVPCAVVGFQGKQVTLANLYVLNECPIPDSLPGARDMAYCPKEWRTKTGHDIRPVCTERLTKGPYILTSGEVSHFVTAEHVRLFDDAALRFYRRTEEIAVLDAHAQAREEWPARRTPEENIYDSGGDNTDHEKALAREFVNVRKWSDALPIAMDFRDWRNRDFAARILLRMCSEAEMDTLGRHFAAELRQNAAESLARPFGQPRGDEKGWMTVAEAMADPDASPEMREWLQARYVDPDAPSADVDEECGMAAPRP